MTTARLLPRLSFAVICVVATLAGASAQGIDWPQWHGPQRDRVWRETGITTELPDEIPIRWRRSIGSGYSGPTVADGRVYVMDRVADPKEIERIHCFDWKTGQHQWTHEYDCVYEVSYKAGPRCSVLVADGLAYALGTMGRLSCLDAKSGKVVWEKDLLRKYRFEMPIWGIAASPILEGGLLIVPTSNSEFGAYLAAFEARTGELRWQAFNDRGNYSAPIVIDQAGQRVLVAWTGDRIIGVAPATGKLLWQHPFKPKNMPLGVASPVLHEDKLLFSGFYDGSLLLRLHQDELGVSQVWRRRGQNERRTDALHSIISTPLIQDGHIYGTCSYGELRCLQLSDGKRVWEDLSAVPKARWSTIHFVPNGDRTFMFNERGELLIGKLSPKGFTQLDRGQLIQPTREQLNRRGGVCWSHPAFAYRHVFARNDEEIVCADLTAAK